MQNSGALARILEIVLVLGNYMNGTSTRGGAIGFKLSSINKVGVSLACHLEKPDN